MVDVGPVVYKVSQVTEKGVSVLRFIDVKNQIFSLTEILWDEMKKGEWSEDNATWRKFE